MNFNKTILNLKKSSHREKHLNDLLQYNLIDNNMIHQKKKVGETKNYIKQNKNICTVRIV